MTPTLCVLSPQTISGLLREFDVQASRAHDFSPLPCPLLPFIDLGQSVVFVMRGWGRAEPVQQAACTRCSSKLLAVLAKEVGTSHFLRQSQPLSGHIELGRTATVGRGEAGGAVRSWTG